MELYRYLFAPVLLAVALSSGHHHRRPVRTQERTAAEAVRPVRPAVAPPAPARPGDLPSSAAARSRADAAH
jgi:hypothetical protein